MSSSPVLVIAVTLSLTLLLVPAGGVAGQESQAAGQEPGDRPDVAMPTPARPDASAPVGPERVTSSSEATSERPAVELAEGERWATVVPVLLWWAGEGKPRLQVCSEAFGGEVGDVCPIEGAPATARSLQIECEGWDCSKLAMRQPVEVRMRVEDGRFLALGERP